MKLTVRETACYNSIAYGSPLIEHLCRCYQEEMQVMIVFTAAVITGWFNRSNFSFGLEMKKITASATSSARKRMDYFL